MWATQHAWARAKSPPCWHFVGSGGTHIDASICLSACIKNKLIVLLTCGTINAPQWRSTNTRGRIASRPKRYVCAEGMLLKSLGTVLLVDDEESIVEFMKEALLDEGYTVFAESDGDRAIATATTHHPDLILCDLHMPGVTGISFVDRIHKNGLAHIPIVMMTADTHAPHDYSDKNIAAYLMKPFDLEELFSCVVRHINTSPDGNLAE